MPPPFARQTPPPAQHGLARWLGLLLLLFWMAAHAAFNTWWLAVDHRSPDPETSRHRAQARAAYDALFPAQPAPLLARISALGQVPPGDPPAPPLLHWLGAAALRWGHGADEVPARVNTFSLILLLFAVYWLLRHVADPAGAAWGAGLAAFIPAIHAASRIYTPDLLLAALLALTLAALVQSRCYRKTGGALLAGLFSGLALLTANTALLYLLPLWTIALPFGLFAALFEAQRSNRDWTLAGQPLLNFAVAAVAAAGIAGPWFWQHAKAFSNRSLLMDWTRSLDPQPLLAVLWGLLNHVLLLPVALLALAGLVIAAIHPRTQRAALWLPLLWLLLLIPLLAATSEAPGLRLLLPLAIPPALCMGVLPAVLPAGTTRNITAAALALILFIPFINLAAFPFGEYARTAIPFDFAPPGTAHDGTETAEILVLAPALVLAPGAPELGPPHMARRSTAPALPAPDLVEEEARRRLAALTQLTRDTLEQRDDYDLFLLLYRLTDALPEEIRETARQLYTERMQALPATYKINEYLTFIPDTPFIRHGEKDFEFQLAFRVDQAPARDLTLACRASVDDANLNRLPPDRRALGYLEWTRTPQPPASQWKTGDYIIIPLRIQAEPMRYTFTLRFLAQGNAFFGRNIEFRDFDLAAVPLAGATPPPHAAQSTPETATADPAPPPTPNPTAVESPPEPAPPPPQPDAAPEALEPADF